MSYIEEGTLLWEPDNHWKNNANITAYMQWLAREKRHDITTYEELWTWSVEEIEDFWQSLWEYFQIDAKTSYEKVLSERKMPLNKWFTRATLNYSEHVFKRGNTTFPAILHLSETRGLQEIQWKKLYKDTANLQGTLKQLGVKKGNRVAAYVANIYEATVAFLATASLGAIWSSASPDFGTQSVIDRFKQIKPKVMITVDGYTYGGREFDRMEVVEQIQSHLPTLEATIVIPYLKDAPNIQSLTNPLIWREALNNNRQTTLTYEYVEFNDPLWILFSSGTTGRPKPIVQSQGGILLEHLKALTFHVDLKEGDRLFWYTTTGWMMWNFVVSGLLCGGTIILYDGSPVYPHANFLFELAERTNMNIFGTSASYLINAMKSDDSPGKLYNLDNLTCISSTGSPLPPEGFNWCYEHVKKDLWIASISGGTDVCTAFILGVPVKAVHAGELQCRGLGAKIESFSKNGKSLTDEIGELVLTEPLPSMPIYFWDDTDHKRLHESYFDVYPRIWRHGDFVKVTERGTCVIYGRSDATINRGGIRIGTSEIYRAVDQVQEIADSLIVDIPREDGDSIVPLFVVMQPGEMLSDELKHSIRRHIRTQCSPRHTPTHIITVSDLPKTLNGKKLEIPIKRLLMGEKVEDVVNEDSLLNPEALTFFLSFAEKIDTLV